MADPLPILTRPQIEAQAGSEVDTDIAAQTAPLQSQVTTLGAEQDRGQASLAAMFGNILPYVQGSAQRVGQSYQDALQAEKGIFTEATSRLGQLRQQSAAQAQALAQQTGAPVPLDAFDAPFRFSESELANVNAGELLHTLGLSQAGVQEAEAFSGKVFPLLQAEQSAALRSSYQDRITALQDEIQRITSSAPSLKRNRINDLLVQERQAQLDQAKYELDKLTNQRSWENDKARIANEKAQLALSKTTAARDYKISQAQLGIQKGQAATDKANTLGYYEYKYKDKQGNTHTYRVPTLAAQQLMESKDARQQDDLIRNRQIDEQSSQATAAGQREQERINLERQAANLNRKQNQLEQQSAAGKVIDAVMGVGQGSETVHTSRSDPVSFQQYDEATDKGDFIPKPIDAASAKALGYEVPAGAKEVIVYWKVSNVYEPVQHRSLSNPVLVYKASLGHGVPDKVVLDAVRKRFGLPDDWNPNAPVTTVVTKATLEGWKFNQLRDEAIRRGWTPSGTPATAPYLRNWILLHEPKDGGSASAVPNTYAWDPEKKVWYNPDTMKPWTGKGAHTPPK